MTRYAIKVVPPEWEETMPLPFDKATHDHADLDQGTRILIYRQGEGIIGEGEVHGFAIHPKEWPAQSKAGLPSAFAQADYLQPIGMLYTRQEVIPADEVHTALDDPSFAEGETWRAIDGDVYQRLTDWPE